MGIQPASPTGRLAGAAAAEPVMPIDRAEDATGNAAPMTAASHDATAAAKAAVPAGESGSNRFRNWPARAWTEWRWALPLVVGFLALAIPTFQGIAKVSWATEQGTHGPIVLALGLWLMVRNWPAMVAAAVPGRPWVGAALLVPALLLYVMARVVGSIVIESAALYFVLLAMLYLFVGWRAMRGSWFAIAYLLLLLPPPGSFVAEATQPLRLQISELAVRILSQLGYPVARSGLNIVVGQYQLEVKAACGGLNSMISLTAIGLFYAHLRQHTRLAYNIFLFAGILVMAILANLVRVMLLILITHYFGDAAAQGFLHQFAGLTMFAVAMGGVLLLDEAASRIWHEPKRRAA